MTEDPIGKLVGFGRACAPVRCAQPSFWAHCYAQRGASRPPPIAASLLLIYPPPQNLSSDPNSGSQGRLSFHLSKLHPTATLHLTELRCTLLCSTAP